jgi:hypothetical protein
VLAMQFIKLAGEDPTAVVVVCVTLLGGGRVVAMLTSSLAVVYFTMASLFYQSLISAHCYDKACVIISLGVVNTGDTSSSSSS